jgi:hypothetical protein
MNQYEFVLALTFIVCAFAVVRHKLGMPSRSMRHMVNGQESDGENVRLRNQIQQLQERIRVLERIVTDRGVETAAQIEALRDRDAIENGDKVG